MNWIKEGDSQDYCESLFDSKFWIVQVRAFGTSGSA